MPNQRKKCDICGFRIRGDYNNHRKGTHHRSKLTPEQLKIEDELAKQ